MELITALDATALVTSVTGVITDNIGPVLAILGFFVGLKVVRGFINRGVKGRV